MDLKKIRKNISYFFGWVALTTCSLIFTHLPKKLVYWAARQIAALAYLMAGKQRKIALESLQIAFGSDKSKAEINKIARDCFTYMAKGAAEMMFLLDKPDLLKSQVSIEGKKHLDDALACGKGAILVSAHFGNFPLMLSRLSLEGYKVNGIMRHMRDERTEEFFVKKRKKTGIKIIYSQPRKTCVDESIRVLRDNETLFILLDQNFGTAGVFVDFFGRKAATATGPVVFARRTGAAILPFFIVRQQDDKHKIIFEPQVKLIGEKTEEETISINIQSLTNIIESYIRRYPAEWGWIHRRWKSRPNEGGG